MFPPCDQFVRRPEPESRSSVHPRPGQTRPMVIVVRRIEPGDVAHLKAVRLSALADAPSAFGSTHAAEIQLTDDEWTRRAARAADGREVAMFLAWHVGEAVGIAGGYRPELSASVVELVSMWTAPPARRAGVARRLVGAVAAWASESDAEVLELWVTDGNSSAIALYEAMGFEFTGDRKPLPSDPALDEVRMRRRLRP